MPRRRLSLLSIATASARFTLRQTRTNLAALQALRRDATEWLPILEQAADETIENLVRVLATAEQSLPASLENMTPSERRQALTESLARSERLLLAAAGELYRSWRLMSSEQHQLIENPPQASFRD
ncbi:MAG: hypothetical protein AAGI24_08955 [Pseudomonadota bacterium]